jgi:hypothetical protein
MALEEIDGFTQKLYRVRNSYHARMVKKAAREGITLQEAVNEAFKQYLGGEQKAAPPAKVKPTASKKK